MAIGRLTEIFTNPKYIYEPIANEDEIRLLYLQPRCKGFSLECDLRAARLSDNPSYVALSYMWGPELPRQIHISGMPWEIRDNLWQALSHIRHQTKLIVLWADAICIDQQNLNERNHQVAQMGEIYSRAESVISWLGVDEGMSSVAIKILSNYGCAPTESLSHSIEDIGSYRLPIVLRCIYALFEREYWSRLWIVQEVSLAKRVTFQCGHASFSIRQLYMFLDNLGSYESYPASDLRCSFNLFDLPNHYTKSDNPDLTPFRCPLTFWEETMVSNMLRSIPAKLCQDYSPMPRVEISDIRKSLLGLCTRYRSSNCTNPRDRIFAVLNLTYPCCKSGISVDYSMTMLQLCYAVLCHHLLGHSYKSSKNDVPGIPLSFYHRLQNVLGVTIEDHLCNSDEYFDDHVVRTRAFTDCRLLYVFPNMTTSTDWPASTAIPTEVPESVASALHLMSVKIRNGFSPSKSELKAHMVYPLSGTFVGVVDVVNDILIDVTTPAECLNVPSPIPGGIASAGNRRQPGKPVQPYNTDAFKEVWKGIAEHLKRSELPNCKFALGENGKIYLVPENAMVNDLVSEFENCDVWAVVRSSSSNGNLNGTIIGRADRYRYLELQDAEDETDESEDLIDLTLDINSFHLLAAYSRRGANEFGVEPRWSRQCIYSCLGFR